MPLHPAATILPPSSAASPAGFGATGRGRPSACWGSTPTIRPQAAALAVALLLLFAPTLAIADTPRTDPPGTQPVPQVPASPTVVPSDAPVVDLGTILVGESASRFLGGARTIAWPASVREHLRTAGVPVRSREDGLFPEQARKARWALGATIDEATSGKTRNGLEVEVAVTWLLMDVDQGKVVSTIVTLGRARAREADFAAHLLMSSADGLAATDAFRSVFDGRVLPESPGPPPGTLASDVNAQQLAVRRRNLRILGGTLVAVGGGALVYLTDQKSLEYSRRNPASDLTWAALVTGNTSGWAMIGGGVGLVCWGFVQSGHKATAVSAGPGFAVFRGSF
jgi:hypothetical protein